METLARNGLKGYINSEPIKPKYIFYYLSYESYFKIKNLPFLTNKELYGQFATIL